MFSSAIWSMALTALALSGAAVVHSWTRDSGGGLEMLQMGIDTPYLLPLLLCCCVYRWIIS
jgi:hypothetical protein